MALQNKRLLYGMLFEAASQTIAEVAANPRHLGAHDVGILAVLHTWGQNLMHHPHLHCVVSGGGLAADGQRWIASKSYYFLPVRVLSRVFRRNYCQLLRQAYEQGQLEFHGELAPLAERHAFQKLLGCGRRPRVGRLCQAAVSRAACVLKYLARYTHRVAIANSRLVRYHAGRVTFRYKDYADHGRTHMMTLSGSEFIRRFLMHVLPKGFMRIRYFGYLANRQRQEKLAHCRRLAGRSCAASCSRLVCCAAGAARREAKSMTNKSSAPLVSKVLCGSSFSGTATRRLLRIRRCRSRRRREQQREDSS